jgi:membrane-bound lytic murein transglycosylase A
MSAAGPFRLRPLAFADLPGWQDDDPSELLGGLSVCRNHIRNVKPYKTGELGLSSGDLLPLLEAAEQVAAQASEMRAFFERETLPFRIERTDGGRGFVTAFFEPEVQVSHEKDSEFRFPFYRRPDDLVDIDDSNRPSGLEPSYAFARRSPEGISPYPDRRAIDEGYLEGRGLEIAWARSKVDVFFTHVQGAARLVYPSGERKRITYAAKAGHPFSPIGRLLIDRGEIPADDISMQSIRDWLIGHPEGADEVLWHNRSYIFFREAEVEDPSKGPIAAAKVPLIPGRSLAVDRTIHTFGYPFFINAPTLTHLDAGQPFARLMLALDTGSAIVGPARGDIFTGSGYEAGELAGTVKNEADFTILIPRLAAARYL